ncbi:nucleotidyltransferase family protein [Aquimarina algicola]|uniref:Nucleotidyltransferase family protein n=1 Tax=Aquimarina algicola TaxID=2589995 RepID=A0A504JN19_9FLAO|nr:nucleotidyltransferase family protein [Aquimarina algicola]TPN89188.1 nucleotidyltransferase family protein [Aquimarina algicola]
MRSIPKILHIILAAGSSSRMGTPKQLLTIGDTTFIEHAIKEALKVANTNICIVLGANYKTLRDHIDHHPIKIVQNKDWQSGMGSSIRCAVRECIQEGVSYQGILISLIDQPLLGYEHYKIMKEYFYKDETKIIATKLKNKLGVPAILPSQYFDELLKLQSDFGARHLIRQHNDVVSVSANDRGIDIDTQEQYNALLKSDFFSEKW